MKFCDSGTETFGKYQDAKQYKGFNMQSIMSKCCNIIKEILDCNGFPIGPRSY